ncbi:uncharacterized protein LOC133524355 [Cydia pomonella]|uniref:uncharacterized protein LOC133524355 n=1 Tax=Cydia pomonella TaxID=82600 RepID=UPI002ADE250D|nr:uncharacterized protein LOC133524355 [Cydia pomonella]
MGCMCCSFSSFVSVCLNAFERATVCTVCAVLTFFLLFTILAVLAIGVGIGFHYCFVTQTVEEMSKAAKLTAGSQEGRRAGSELNGLRRANVVRAVEQGAQRAAALRRHLQRREIADLPPFSNNQTANLSALSLKEDLVKQNVSKCINC